MVPPLPVFRFVVDRVRLDLHLADGEIPLEIGAVVHCVPEAKLNIREDVQRLFCACFIFQRQPDEQAVFALGDKQRLGSENAVFPALNHAVAKAVAAGIAIQLRFCGLPARVPDCAAVFDIETEPLLIGRAVVVAVAGETAQTRVPVEAVTACRVGQKGEEILAAEIVDPRKGRACVGDHVFPLLVVEMAEMHVKNSSSAGSRWSTGCNRKRLSIQMWQNHSPTITDFCAKCNTLFIIFLGNADFFAFPAEMRKSIG